MGIVIAGRCWRVWSLVLRFGVCEERWRHLTLIAMSAGLRAALARVEMGTL